MKKSLKILSLFLVLLLILPFSHAAVLSFTDNGSKLILENGYIYLEFNKSNPCIDVIKGDFLGGGTYGGNLVATNSDGRQGIVLETVNAAGVLNKSSKSNSAITYNVLQNDAAGVKIRINGIKDAASGNIVTSAWVLTLNANSRKFTLETSTTVSATQSIKAIKISSYLQQWCIMGFYQNGVVQYVQDGAKYFSSTNSLKTFYTMDNTNGSLAIVPVSTPNVVESNLVSDASLFKTGLEQVMDGSYPVKNSWNTSGWGSASNINVTAGTTYTANYDIFPNKYAFPTHTVKAGTNMDFDNPRAFYTAVYGSAAGCLGSYLQNGSAYPTLACPGRAYGELYTFFDPDSWSTVATLSFSGDPYLENEARKILELSESYLKSDGQIPHHFDAGTPVYVAISGASQTGPNIFWLLGAVDYVTGTGNTAWLNGHYGNLKKAADWILGFYDANRKLLKVNGPLWEDTFIRENYTYDTNAFMLRLLPLMGNVATYCGDSTSAAVYNQRTQDIKTGLEGLWNGTDHYVTHRGAAWTTKNGTWSESGQILSQTSTANGDPKKAIISNSGVTFPNNLMITAKVKVNSWTDDAYARAGISLFSNIGDGRGYNLLFHQNHSTVQFLDDEIAWGPSFDFNWSDNTWYWFKLKSQNGTLYGKVWQDGSAEAVQLALFLDQKRPDRVPGVKRGVKWFFDRFV